MKNHELVNLISSKECNNRCKICARSDEEIKEMSIDEVEKNLVSLRERGCRNIILTGGEPTLRKDLFEVIDLCKKLDFERLYIQTNGRRFSKSEFVKRIASNDMVDIFLSIHGHKPDIHEEVSGVKGSFKETMKGIDNLVTFGLSLRTNTVICKPNHQFLDEVANLLIKKGVKTIQFSFVHPRGEALHNKSSMVPEIEESISSLKKALDRNTDDIKVLVEAVPFCLLGDHHIHATERILPKVI